MARDERRTELIRKGRDAARLVAVAQPLTDRRAVLGERLEERHARREDRRLRDARVVEAVGRPVEADLAELVAEDPVGFLEDGARSRRGFVHRAAHADGLRALSGEDERERSGHATTLASARREVVLSMQWPCSEYETL